MLTLLARLRQADSDFRALVAEAWGLQPPPLDPEALAAALLDASRVLAMWEALPGPAQAALAALHRRGGKMPWALFERRYGPLRDLPPARRRAEAPHLRPQSPAEWLWYRALIGRAFLETPQGLVEHAYIPGDVALLLPLPGPKPSGGLGEPAWGRPAPEGAYAHPRPARPWVTLQVWVRALAWVRSGRGWEALPLPPGWQVAAAWLRGLWRALGLLDAQGRLQREAVGQWLTAPLSQAWAAALQAWRTGPQVNDLRALPHLRFEGPWQNDPVAARARLWAWLRALPPNTWWNLEAFVAAVRENEPHFQRPAPQDFSSWYIRRAVDGAYLQGFEHWDEVDGALVRFWLTGPAHWLGLVDLAAAEPDGPATAFRLTAWAPALLADRVPAASGLPAEEARPRWLGRGLLEVPWTAPRAVHYQIARLTHPDGWHPTQGLTYRLTAEALRRAREQGLQPAPVQRWLAAHVEAWPPAVGQAVARALQGQPAARVQPGWVVLLPAPQALAALQRSPAARHVLRVLGPTAALIDPQGRDAVLQALWLAGFPAEVLSPDESAQAV